jgi:hypothetical protein
VVQGQVEVVEHGQQVRQDGLPGVLAQLLRLPGEPLLDVLGLGQGAQAQVVGLAHDVAGRADPLAAQGGELLFGELHLRSRPGGVVSGVVASIVKRRVVRFLAALPGHVFFRFHIHLFPNVVFERGGRSPGGPASVMDK